MNDPKLIGAPIVRHTLCLVGSHVFSWTTSGLNSPAPDWTRCDCGAYSYAEAKEAQMKDTEATRGAAYGSDGKSPNDSG